MRPLRLGSWAGGAVGTGTLAALAPELEVEGRTVEEVVDMVVSRVAVPE